MPTKAELERMRFGQIADLREQADPQGNAQLAPFEHMAYARELTQENPLNALGIAAAAPGYYLAKQPGLLQLMQKLGIVGNKATPASLDQLKGAYKGIWQGLTTPAPVPEWKQPIQPNRLAQLQQDVANTQQRL